MSAKIELERLTRERDNDTEWLRKYIKIADGLQQIAEIQFDSCNHDIDEWGTIYNGLTTLSMLMRGDIEGRADKKTKPLPVG